MMTSVHTATRIIRRISRNRESPSLVNCVQPSCRERERGGGGGGGERGRGVREREGGGERERGRGVREREGGG